MYAGWQSNQLKGQLANQGDLFLLNSHFVWFNLALELSSTNWRGRAFVRWLEKQLFVWFR